MKDKKHIHIVGSGGAAGVGMTRCLQKEPNYYIQGHDESEWGELISECHKETDSESINLWNCDMVIPVPDKAVASRYGISDISFCPNSEVVKLCQDKAKTAEMLGGLAAKTYWLRDTVGAGGKGAQMISEYLPGRNYSVELVYYQGSFISYFQKERISYLVKSREPNVTASGSSAISICVDNKELLKVARKAISTIDQRPHGFYGVDLREDENGVPKVTEINAGRLLTASYVYFYLTDYNLPLSGVKRYFGEKYQLGKYPEGWGIIRSIDCLPKIFPPEVTKKWI